MNFRLLTATITVLLAVSITAVGQAVLADSDHAAAIPLIDDIRTDAATAKAQGSIVVIVTTQEYCTYCEFVKNDFLQPLLMSGELDGKAVVRELALDGLDVKDFSGKSADAGEFGGRYGAQFSPTVIFLGHDGGELHPPIIGVQSRDFYGYYLERAIEKAYKALDFGS